MNVCNYRFGVERYGRRHFAVIENDPAQPMPTLICVCVYRKGANEILRRLTGMLPAVAVPQLKAEDFHAVTSADQLTITGRYSGVARRSWARKAVSL